MSSGVLTPVSGLANLQLTQPQILTILTQAYQAASVDPVYGLPIPAYSGPNSAVGPIFQSIAQLLALDLQQQLLYVASISRMASIPDPLPTGGPNPDLDSFVNQFGIYRIPAVAATGTVTFTTQSVVQNNAVVIPAYNATTNSSGFVIQTAGGVQYQVVPDPTNSTGDYSSTLNGYVINPGSSSCNCLVQCLSSGVVGNTGANTINVLYGGYGVPQIAALSTVTNANALTNGVAQEAGSALKARFTLAMSTGTVGTINAISAAVAGVQAGLTYSVADQVNASDVATPGYFTVVVALLGATTATPSTLLSAVSTAVNAVRSAGVSYAVIGPTLDSVNVSATLHIAANANSATVIANATQAFNAYIQSIGLNPLGGSTSAQFSETMSILRNLAGVTNVTSLLLNSGTSDVTAAFANMLIPGTISFTTTYP